MISVVIPAHNEEKLLPLCLESLAAQTTKKKFEVLVVDNASMDRTAKIAKSFQKKLTIRVISEEEKGRGIARAVGFAKSKGTIIFSTDADTVVPKDWIEHMLQVFENPKVVAVAGKVVVKDLSWIHNQTFRLMQRSGEVLYRILFGHWWLGGYSFAIRRETYEKVGGFCPYLNAMEDVDLSMKVKKHGKIHQARNTVVFSGRRYQKGFLRGSFGYVRVFHHYLTHGRKNAILDDIR